MNLLHMKYAVEIAKTNSINKAAEVLYVGQPSLSRAIKELENSLGITIFERTAKGMFLTSDGEIFIRYAQTVLKQVDEIEKIFSEGTVRKKHFAISVPRASYISDAFARFSKLIEKNIEVEMFYRETNSMRAIKNILQDDYELSIIRYAKNYDKYYKNMMEEKGLNYELITEFRYTLLMSEESPLASVDNIRYEDLKDYIEIAHGDPYVPTLPFSEVKKEELPDNSRRRIFIFERGSQFELLSQNPETYMWVSPIPKQMIKRYGLIQKNCDENKRVYRDVLMHRKNYVLSDLDSMFIDQLVKVKRELFGRQDR